VDNANAKKLVSYLKQLGLTAEQSAVYLYLAAQGPSSVLDISRGLKTGRTKLYPLLEELASQQLVIAHERHYGTTYETSGVDTLNFLVGEYENKAQTLRGALPAAVAELERLKSYTPQGSRVVEYRGVEGLKQMNFNLSKAAREYRVFELANLDKHAGMPRYFAEKQRQTQIENRVTSYDLTNNPNWKLDTKLQDYQKFSKARYIDPKVFEIKFEMYIYNNCVALLNYDQTDVFGVEIYNPALGAQQTQLFDLLWSMSKDI
jgi:sugar-specific transcriptional regulator TrmB